ncbi:hypothetical protein OHR01_005081 [Salmonella enterica]|nr:hypothetical protein [Salmonella enterica]EKG3675909.1 hypothetical protein [Salmonella enterica]
MITKNHRLLALVMLLSAVTTTAHAGAVIADDANADISKQLQTDDTVTMRIVNIKKGTHLLQKSGFHDLSHVADEGVKDLGYAVLSVTDDDQVYASGEALVDGDVMDAGCRLVGSVSSAKAEHTKPTRTTVTKNDGDGTPLDIYLHLIKSACTFPTGTHDVLVPIRSYTK